MGHAYFGRRFAEIVALTETTLASAPELIGDDSWFTYNSACAAALLSADAQSEPNVAERARVRALAHAWLAGEVQRWRAWIASGERVQDARQRLGHALGDPDFASVRGGGLDALTEVERDAWRELWDGIERAREPGAK